MDRISSLIHHFPKKESQSGYAQNINRFCGAKYGNHIIYKKVAIYSQFHFFNLVQMLIKRCCWWSVLFNKIFEKLASSWNPCKAQIPILFNKFLKLRVTTSSCSNYKISTSKLFKSHLNNKLKEKHAKQLLISNGCLICQSIKQEWNEGKMVRKV